MPGFDRTGPRGEGAMTGGRRGLCGGTANYISPSQVYGIGRGGRPLGGGRGRAWGGGRGYGRAYWDESVDPAIYPLPDQPVAGFANTINGILDRLSQLAAAVADLHDRFAAGGSGSTGTVEGADENRG